MGLGAPELLILLVLATVAGLAWVMIARGRRARREAEQDDDPGF
jgi:hypothetical protein